MRFWIPKQFSSPAGHSWVADLDADLICTFQAQDSQIALQMLCGEAPCLSVSCLQTFQAASLSRRRCSIFLQPFTHVATSEQEAPHKESGQTPSFSYASAEDRQSQVVVFDEDD